MADFEALRYEVEDRVATITLNRPEKLNALDATLLAEWPLAIDAADRDDEVRAIIITGAGRAFCAGADLSEGPDSFRRDVPELEYRDEGGIVSLRMFESTKPIIVAFNGVAVGAGVTIALAADIRLASERARFGLVFAQRGLVAEAASSWFLPRVVGISRAMEWTATARIFDAQEALAGGLIRSVHPHGELISAARDLAAEIVSNTAPVAVALTRQMMWRMLGAAHPMEAHRVDSRLMWHLGRSPDVDEGVNSFTEKRAAHFPMRPSRDLPAPYPWWDPLPFRA
jgi:enoyl-CoA hydratase/carnithine racemase